MNGTSKSKAQKAKSPVTAKVDEPHKAFGHPAEVVADPALSKHEKISALDSLEQDARQLAAASDEGMSGGEGTNLREVLIAKKTLELPASEAAFAVVLQTFQSKLDESHGTDAYPVISQAIGAIAAARRAIERMEHTPPTPSGVAKPGSKEELQEELEKEKLDPGA